MVELGQDGVVKTSRGMSFHDLEVFNLAMLAKEGWRLTQFLDSLVARILREKYYPDGTFLQAMLGRRPSYAWRSIFQAREVLKGGLVWMDGNRKSIRIWGDNWIPPSYTHQIHSPIRGLDVAARANTFIDQTTGGTFH